MGKSVEQESSRDLVRGCHLIARGDVAEALRIAPDILQNGLQVRRPRGLSMGMGAWAYQIDLVPEENRVKPLVVFEVSKEYVEEKEWGVLRDGRRYFTLRLGGKLKEFDYVPMQILGFLNFPPPFPVYEGPIGFFSR